MLNDEQRREVREIIKNELKVNVRFESTNEGMSHYFRVKVELVLGGEVIDYDSDSDSFTI